CDGADTGQPDGTCAPVRAGADPREDCSTEPPSSCGRDGTCDGNGGCRRYDPGTECGSGSCSGSTFTPAKTCTAMGPCQATQEAMSCGAAACTTSGCRSSCSVDADCGANGYCTSDTKTCAPKKTLGGGCVAGNECVLGACIDGVCCDSACQAKC